MSSPHPTLSPLITHKCAGFGRVTTFVHAREDSSQNCKISVQGVPAPAVPYDKGVRATQGRNLLLHTQQQVGDAGKSLSFVVGMCDLHSLQLLRAHALTITL